MNLRRKQINIDELHNIMKPSIRLAFDRFIATHPEFDSSINELFKNINFTIGGIDKQGSDVYSIIFYIAGESASDALVFFIGLIDKYNGKVEKASVIYPPKAMEELFPDTGQ